MPTRAKSSDTTVASLIVPLVTPGSPTDAIARLTALRRALTPSPSPSVSRGAADVALAALAAHPADVRVAHHAISVLACAGVGVVRSGSNVRRGMSDYAPGGSRRFSSSMREEGGGDERVERAVISAMIGFPFSAALQHTGLAALQNAARGEGKGRRGREDVLEVVMGVVKRHPAHTAVLLRSVDLIAFHLNQEVGRVGEGTVREACACVVGVSKKLCGTPQGAGAVLLACVAAAKGEGGLVDGVFCRCLVTAMRKHTGVPHVQILGCECVRVAGAVDGNGIVSAGGVEAVLEALDVHRGNVAVVDRALPALRAVALLDGHVALKVDGPGDAARAIDVCERVVVAAERVGCGVGHLSPDTSAGARQLAADVNAALATDGRKLRSTNGGRRSGLRRFGWGIFGAKERKVGGGRKGYARELERERAEATTLRGGAGGNGGGRRSGGGGGTGTERETEKVSGVFVEETPTPAGGGKWASGDEEPGNCGGDVGAAIVDEFESAGSGDLGRKKTKKVKKEAVQADKMLMEGPQVGIGRAGRNATVDPRELVRTRTSVDRQRARSSLNDPPQVGGTSRRFRSVGGMFGGGWKPSTKDRPRDARRTNSGRSSVDGRRTHVSTDGRPVKRSMDGWPGKMSMDSRLGKMSIDGRPVKRSMDGRSGKMSNDGWSAKRVVDGRPGFDGLSAKRSVDGWSAKRSVNGRLAKCSFDGRPGGDGRTGKRSVDGRPSRTNVNYRAGMGGVDGRNPPRSFHANGFAGSVNGNISRQASNGFGVFAQSRRV